jgi:hypothetical protein
VAILSKRTQFVMVLCWTWQGSRAAGSGGYLELARRRTLPLATLDQELRTAATAIGVTVLGAN